MPAIVKAAEPTSFLTAAVVRDIVDSGILPEGSLQLVCGPGQGILEPLDEQDVVTFTGSASTGRLLKAHPNIIERAIPFNMEADSLNAAVLGPDATPGTPEFDLFIKEVRREMTTKAGQKCTAIRRVIVPADLVEDVQIALGKQLAKTTIGDPTDERVRMGALVSRAQVEEVRRSIAKLAEESELVYGSLDGDFEVIGADKDKGAFLSPLLFLNADPLNRMASHVTEAFGPVATLMPYQNLNEALQLAQLGKGSLVSSIATADDEVAREFVLGAATHHGRILVLNRESAVESTGHGSPMPLLNHGGPGRAGGGEELGGLRSVKHYLVRCAVQGTPTTLTKLTGQYQPGGKYTETDKHPFQYHFEDLQPGLSILTHKRTLTDSDIINFANLTWDHFYAHTDITSLGGSIFEKRTAHGYFILSAAAGLFVYPNKGPVAANYGLDSVRFLRPLYHNDTIQVRLTCREKMDREHKGRQHPAGVVKWYVEVFDQANELVAMATILTLVSKKNPFFEVTRANLLAKLDQLTEDTVPQWGRMTPQHLMEHLEFFMRMAIGEVPTEITTPEERLEKFQESLYNHRKMPRGFEHPMLRQGEPEDLRFGSLGEAKQAFLDAYDKFEAYFKENPEAQTPNTVFGLLDKELWDLLNRKHLTHHFEQFGLR